jgi:hypothetical protein
VVLFVGGWWGVGCLWCLGVALGLFLVGMGWVVLWGWWCSACWFGGLVFGSVFDVFDDGVGDDGDEDGVDHDGRKSEKGVVGGQRKETNRT